MQRYLRYQGGKFADRFDALCYVHLTYTLDSHDCWGGPGAPGLADGTLPVACPTLVVAVDSDVLYPLAAQRELAAAIPGAELHVIESPHGHDSFLIEIVSLNARVVEFLRKHGVAAPDGSAAVPPPPSTGMLDSGGCG
jgi:homoserine O-acetyltransferase/O-succinyltransferase